MQGPETTSDSAQLDDLLRSAQQHESAVALALDLGDDVGLLVAAARLRQILLRARVLLEQLRKDTSDRSVSHVLAFGESTRGMRKLLRRAHAVVAAPEIPKLTQWFLAMRRSLVRTKGPHLHERS